MHMFHPLPLQTINKAKMATVNMLNKSGDTSHITHDYEQKVWYMHDAMRMWSQIKAWL